MSKFEVRLAVRIETEDGTLLVENGGRRFPCIELKSGESWQKALAQALRKIFGGDISCLVELKGVKTLTGGQPVLEIQVICYLKEKPSLPVRDKRYKWKEPEREPRAAETVNKTGATFDPDAEVELYTDGASRGNPGAAAIGALLVQKATGREEELYEIIGRATSNQAEYTALIRGLKLAIERGARWVRHLSDSELMVRQLNGRYKVKSPGLQALFKEVRETVGALESFSTQHIPREENTRADSLANRALDEAESMEEE
ncbi:MAG: ribonuclease HI family protein [Gemmatimonadota bacterium]|nr:ribonuclease HI family protein [Gemmatimonadota bacterium]